MRWRTISIGLLITGMLEGLALLLAQSPGPVDPLVAQGRLVFETAGGVGCASCHGPFGQGDIGPRNRGANRNSVLRALGTVPAMSFLQSLTDQDIDAVVAYLQYLGTLTPVNITIKSSALDPATVNIPAGEPIQFIFDNKDRQDYTIASAAMGIADTVLPRRKAQDVVWQAPPEAGSFELVCANCGDTGALLTVVVQPTTDQP